MERSTAVVSYTWLPIQGSRAAFRDKCAVPSPDRYRPSVRRGNPCRGLHTGTAAGIFRSWDFLPILFWDRKTYTVRRRCAVYCFLPVSWKGTGHGDIRDPIIIQSIVFVFKLSPGIQWDKSLLKWRLLPAESVPKVSPESRFL